MKCQQNHLYLTMFIGCKFTQIWSHIYFDFHLKWKTKLISINSSNFELNDFSIYIHVILTIMSTKYVLSSDMLVQKTSFIVHKKETFKPILLIIILFITTSCACKFNKHRQMIPSHSYLIVYSNIAHIIQTTCSHGCWPCWPSCFDFNDILKLWHSLPS